MLFTSPIPTISKLKKSICDAYFQDETECIRLLLSSLNLSPQQLTKIHHHAYDLVKQIRASRLKKSGLDAFLYEYDLSSEEGITLMCLAEAFLRIPDKSTIDRLLRDKITSADWQNHIKKTDNLWVNATTWALMLTGKVLSDPQSDSFTLGKIFKKLIKTSGEPLIRKAVQQAMKVLSSQFVLGKTIADGLTRASKQFQNYTFSYDMLGEAARTALDAQRYFRAYHDAITTIGRSAPNSDLFTNPGISVKLSALHPRYEYSQHEYMLESVIANLLELAILAKQVNIGLTIDAEESYRLDISLAIFEAVYSHPSLAEYEGLGLALQAYQKRAFSVIDWLVSLAERQQKRIPLRLVKGAYWDTEIKNAQVLGLESYPVFTRKTNTDVSYLACAQKIIQHSEHFFAQFATHNAFTVAAISEMVEPHTRFEFQCLHGMGHSLYDHLIKSRTTQTQCRIYAPIGCYEDLLPYLVRRLLENGANTSFVNRLVDEKLPIEAIIANPIEKTQKLSQIPHPNIPAPSEIYGTDRTNSSGIELAHIPSLQQLQVLLNQAAEQSYFATSLIPNSQETTDAVAVTDPSHQKTPVGKVKFADPSQVNQALANAIAYKQPWHDFGVEARANLLENLATQLEKNREKFLYLAIREAGKTLPDAIAELREAIDFCRYYANEARNTIAPPKILTGATGESNQLFLRGRGVFICISPWNFPLAIFLGQITAALVTGNVVIAKPSEYSPLIAYEAVKLMHECGFPPAAIQLIQGDGAVGTELIRDPRINGVMFTGSTNTAKAIQRQLTEYHSDIIPMVAETGGLNAMIVDSSALTEQVVADVIASAFGSAGQRCSALRVLYLQEDCASRIVTMLKGAMAELRIGDPALLSTDIGPVINRQALDKLHSHFHHLHGIGKLIYQVPISKALADQGYFFGPTAFEISSILQLEQEVFGPFLHVIRYKAQDLPKIIADINRTQYGLTLGIHSRIDETIDLIVSQAAVGNLYVNRNMIGAVVGVQPFGGQGLSGTGPKAGGPHYLPRLCTEHVLSVNTTAAGGNTTLMMLEETC